MNEEFTVKLSPVNDTASILCHEYDVLSQLGDLAGIPRVTSFRLEAFYSAIIFQCLDASLNEVFESCHRSFSHHTVGTIGDQLICRLQNIHLCNFIHRDIKPTNVLIGTGQDACTIYLIDFSITKQYRDPSMHHHIPFDECGGSLSNPAFTSINGHLRCELGSLHVNQPGLQPEWVVNSTPFSLPMNRLLKSVSNENNPNYGSRRSPPVDVMKKCQW
ncbi:kinase-like domain-containing protein [Melanogaster broomeanus]|nr:kinase-like domain-containing protein [Melanogaster broomeanus]